MEHNKRVSVKISKIRHRLLFLFLVLAVFSIRAQTVYTRYWVGFTDKNNSSYSVSNPSQFLSQRALTRRSNQSIAVTSDDLPVDTSYIRKVAATGALVMSRSRWFNGVIVRITNQNQIAAINALNCVKTTRPLARVKPRNKTVNEVREGNNQKVSSNQSDVYNYGQSKGQIYLLNGECLHNKGYNGSGMQIGIIDDGFANSQGAAVFDTLWQTHQILAAHDFYYDDSLVYNEGGHGTYVLSCMAANESGQMIGTAPKAKFYLLRSEIDSTEKIVEVYQWVSAIEYADSAGADIINSSLGYTLFDDASQNFSWADLNGRTAVASLSATMAARRGMIVCVAAGNEGCGNNTGSSTACWQKISVPADADSILAVGSVNGAGLYSSFSSTGNTADGRIKPDVAAQGESTIVANSNGIISGNGTSFASPTIAGMVACLWQGNPTKTNMQVIQAIKKSASQYSHPDSLLGYGIPDFCIADQILKGNIGIAPINHSSQNILCPNTSCEVIISAYDLAGRLILVQKVSASPGQDPETLIQSIDFSTTEEGMYLIRLIASNGNTFTKKILK